MGKKLTLIKQKTTYHIKHYDLDDETIIKEFGSIEEFEQYEDLNSFLVSSEFDASDAGEASWMHTIFRDLLWMQEIVAYRDVDALGHPLHNQKFFIYDFI